MRFLVPLAALAALVAACEPANDSGEATDTAEEAVPAEPEAEEAVPAEPEAEEETAEDTPPDDGGN